ncbi:alpha/beta hydrolase fold-3 domain-containing protein [Xylaria sp. CBS 124048]|nr:alpha/beta hydrolase fold-3 domain-containing protein [Xylaria sp. CBS 124048]
MQQKMPNVRFPGRPLISYPVLRLLYKALYTTTVIARLPLWIIGYSLFRGMRPLPTWNIRQSLMIRIFTESLIMSSRTETPVPQPLNPGEEKDRWETMASFPNHVYRGPLEHQDVKPAAIGGTWYPKKPSDPANAPVVVLHLHGGAFVLSNGRSTDYGAMCDRFLQYGNVGAIFIPQYRLSSRPTSAPFPAALQDSLTSYLYLVRTLGIPPSHITISGDGAGGNLAIALLRYLVEYGVELEIPQPRSAVIIAPWVSPVKFLWPNITIMSNPNFYTDFLGLELGRWGAKSYIPREMSPEHPYISPLGHPFHTSVPLLVTLGEAEILAVDGRKWIDEMRRVEKNVVESYYESGAPHATVLFGHILGFKASAAAVAERIGIFIRKHA